MQPAFICRSCLSRLKQHGQKRLKSQQGPLLAQAWQDGTRTQELGLTVRAGSRLWEQKRKLGTASHQRSRSPEHSPLPVLSTESIQRPGTSSRPRLSPHSKSPRKGHLPSSTQESEPRAAVKKSTVNAYKQNFALQTSYPPTEKEFWDKFQDTFEDIEVTTGDRSSSISMSFGLNQNLDAASAGVTQGLTKPNFDGSSSLVLQSAVHDDPSNSHIRRVSEPYPKPQHKKLFDRNVTGKRKDESIANRGHEGRDRERPQNPMNWIQTYNEYSYLRHHLDSTELQQFSKWKKSMRKVVSLRNDYNHVSHKMVRKLKWLLNYETLEEMEKAWKSLDVDRRKRIWPNIMVSCLICCPGKAQKLLHATMLDPLQPGYAIKDVIQFVATRLSLVSTKDAAYDAEALCDTVLCALEKIDRGHIPFRQNIFYLLSTKIGITKLEELYNCLNEKMQKLHPQTLLQFASRFAQDIAYKDLALQILVGAVESGVADLNSPQWASLCTTVLSIKAEDAGKDDLSSPADTFGVLLEHGLVPNMVNYTALIRALYVAGQARTAWDVGDMMQQQNIKPDSIVLATLFNGAKNALDAGTMGKVIAMAVKHNVIDTIFWNDILSSVLYFSEAEARDKKMQIPRAIPAFGPMLYYYSKVFDLAPLQELIPINLGQILGSSPHAEMPPGWEVPGKLFPVLHEATSAVTEKLTPTAATLCIMFIAYVKSISQPYGLISLYAYVRQLLIKGHNVATRLVQKEDTILHDVLIKAMCEWPGMLRAALDIVGDMLKETLQDANSMATAAAVPKEESSTSGVIHPTPSVHTWSILLNGFMFHKQKSTADRIFAMMREHNIKPNLVTWNTLLAGYARDQNVKRTVHALHKIEEEGYEADSFTMRAFSRLVEKTSALKEMQDSIDRRKRRLERREKAGL